MSDLPTERKMTSKDVLCSVCAAQPGQPCHGSAYSGRSHLTVQSHTARVELAKTITAVRRG